MLRYIRVNMPGILRTALIASVFFFVLSSASYAQPREFLRLRSTSQGTPVEAGPSSTMRSVPQYYISPGDKIEIFVWQNPDLSREIKIRDDGKLSYPLAGTIQASGLTIDGLQDELTSKFSAYIRSPQVTVMVKEPAGNKIVVLGQVAYPGVYTYNGSLDIIEAVAMAGDFLPSGRRESVLVISDNLTENPKVRKINALSALRDGMKTPDMLIRPNDVVYVPRSTIADFNKFLDDIQPTITTLSSFFTMGTNAYTFGQDARAWFLHRDVKVIRGD